VLLHPPRNARLLCIHKHQVWQRLLHFTALLIFTMEASYQIDQMKSWRYDGFIVSQQKLKIFYINIFTFGATKTVIFLTRICNYINDCQGLTLAWNVLDFQTDFKALLTVNRAHEDTICTVYLYRRTMDCMTVPVADVNTVLHIVEPPTKGVSFDVLPII